MLIVFLLFIAGILKSTSSTVKSPAAIKYKAFGCEYEKKGYVGTTTPRASWPLVNPVYSEPVSGRLTFKDEREFRIFRDSLTTIALEELVRKPYDTVTPFLNMFDKFVESKSDSFEKFYKAYTPLYPPGGEDGITALMRIYNRLIEVDTRVVNSFLVGTIDKDVGDSALDSWLNRHKGLEPDISFQHEGLLGIIQIRIDGDDGVILIDMWDYKSPIPVVMMGSKHRLTTKAPTYYQDIGLEPSFHVFDDYILIRYSEVEISGEPGEIRFKKYTGKRDDIIYFKRSLCSFVPVVQKVSLLHSHRTIAKFSPHGQFEAYVSIDVEKCEAFLDKTELDEGYGLELKLNGGTKINLKKFDSLYTQEEKVIQLVGSKLGLGRGILKQKLKIFAEKICAADANTTKFREVIPHWDWVINGPPQEKNFITRGREALERSRNFA